VLFGHELGKAFLVPDSCRAKTTSENVIEDTLEND